MQAMLELCLGGSGKIDGDRAMGRRQGVESRLQLAVEGGRRERRR
jgi:hypothetical protein